MSALRDLLEAHLSTSSEVESGYLVGTPGVQAPSEEEQLIQMQAAEFRRQRALHTDEVLFERIANERSEEAFSELYDRYASRVYSLLLHMLRAEEDAQDLLQEVFVLVWQKAPLYFENRGNVAAWVFSLARNRAVDELRSKRYKVRGKETPLTAGEDRPDLEKIIADHKLPDRNLHHADAQREIKFALRELTPDQRSVIDLAYFAGLTHLEIADRLSMPVGTVKTKIRQGVMKLGKLLRPHF